MQKAGSSGSRQRVLGEEGCWKSAAQATAFTFGWQSIVEVVRKQSVGPVKCFSSFIRDSLWKRAAELASQQSAELPRLIELVTFFSAAKSYFSQIEFCLAGSDCDWSRSCNAAGCPYSISTV